MKVVIITAVSSFFEDIKSMLKRSEVGTFSYTHVIGYKPAANTPLDEHWFTATQGEDQSVLFYAFVAEPMVNAIIKTTDDMNEREGSRSHIHVAVLNIEQTNKIEK